LFEDRDVIAVDKPAGVTAQPTPSRAGESLVDQVTTHLGRDAGMVHRLDRETSGITIFGKSKDATSALAEAFRHRKAEKRYLAVTGPGMPKEGTIDLPLSKDPSRPGRWRASNRANGLPAQTAYALLYDGRFCIVSLHPRTGRTHQLRAHLTALGCPILGDVRYGGATSLGDLPAPRCLLHAFELRLPHPSTGAELVLKSPVPEDLVRFFAAANLDVPH
ncbi:MAG: RluA family pseudouridine synthase, partial [Myxococcaceae bacterium]